MFLIDALLTHTGFQALPLPAWCPRPMAQSGFPALAYQPGARPCGPQGFRALVVPAWCPPEVGNFFPMELFMSPSGDTWTAKEPLGVRQDT